VGATIYAFLLLATAFVIGAIAIIVGWVSPITAFLLPAFTLPTAIFFHNNLGAHTQTLMFPKNGWITGAYLLLAADGGTA
jgi:putative oxidoreductase